MASLAVLAPGRGSSMSRLSIGGNYDETADVWEKAINTARRAKSLSEIEFKPVDTSHSFDRLMVPGRRPSGSNASPSRSVSVISRARSRLSRTSLGAWAKYPSHTRWERNASAGLADGVRCKDFAQSDESPLLKKKRTKPNLWAKLRHPRFRKRLLSDIAERFRPRFYGFRRAESGHRTSIADGGELEYPELELLPGSFGTTFDTRNAPSVDGMAMSYSRASSIYGASSPASPVQSEVPRNNRTAAEWAAFYRQYLWKDSSNWLSQLHS